MRSVSIYILVILLTSLTSCLSLKPLQFKKADKVMVSKNSNEPQIDFIILGHNPNNWSIKITELQTKVTIDGQTYADLELDTVMRLKRKTDFAIPVSLKLTEDDLKKLIKTGLAMFLFGKDVPIEIKGDFILKKFLFRKKFSFQFNEKIDPKMLKDSF